MKCSKCGQELENDALVCPFCGQAVSDEDRQQAQYGDKNLTKKEFLQLPGMKSIKSNVNGCGIAFYILGVLNIIIYAVAGSFPWDGIFLILLGLGVHLAKSRVCAILSLVYAVFGVIIALLMTQNVTGYLIVVVAVYAVIYTFKFHKAWNEYQLNGTLPVEKSKK